MAISRKALLAAVLSAMPLAAQFGVFRNLGHTPQADTPEEFDLYLKIASEPDPVRCQALVNEFSRLYGESELIGSVYQYQMLAHERLDNLDGVLVAGVRALEHLPENVITLVTMASAIPNRVASDEGTDGRLATAEKYASRAFEALARKQIPRAIRFADWQEYRAKMESRLHETLGHVAVKRGDLEVATTELRAAVEKNPEPEGRQLFRLGVIHAWAGRLDDAKSALERAAQLGPDVIRQRALREIEKLDANR